MSRSKHSSEDLTALVIGATTLGAFGMATLLAVNSHKPPQAESPLPQQTNADIAFRLEKEEANRVTAFALRELEGIKAKSLDGEGRIHKDGAGIYVIYSNQPKALTDTSSEAALQKRVQSRLGQFAKDDKRLSTPEAFTTLYSNLLGLNQSVSYVQVSTVNFTFNANSGRICETKPGTKGQDCYSVQNLTPGTQLDKDIALIRVHTPKAP